jgi:glycosyltransferase involved in cell wall biosynthesis
MGGIDQRPDGKPAYVPLVVYWNNLPSPYMVDRFNALVDRGSVDFEAWFSDRETSDRSWTIDESTWRFKYRYIPAWRIFGLKIHFPISLITGDAPDLLISLYSEPSFVCGWFLARMRRAKTGFRVLMTFDRWVRRSRMKDALKRYLFSRADAFETPGEDGRQFALRYGANESRIFIATHTVNETYYTTKSADRWLARDEIRRRAGAKGVAFLYVGRLWWGKGVEYLLEAFTTVQQQSSNEVSLLVLGDGPDEGRLKKLCADRNLRNVYFAGFIQREQMMRWYFAADVFVFPTLGDPYGLAVDEAMACGLPVITTSAAGEIRTRVREGESGFIVPPEDAPALARRMLEISGDGELRLRMAEAASTCALDRTPQKWAIEFENLVFSVCGDATAKSAIAEQTPTRGTEMLVVYWNNSPAPYLVERVNALVESAPFEFEAWFNDRTEPDRSWEVSPASWKFRYRFVPTLRLMGWKVHLPIMLFGRRPDLLVSLYAEPSFVLGWLLARLRGIPTAFWVEVTFDSWVRRAAWKEMVKRFIFKRVDALVTVAADGRDYALRYGASAERIFFAPHSIDVKHFKEQSRSAIPHREQLRADLGLIGVTFIYVGRLWTGKGLAYLLLAFGEVQRTLEREVSLLIIGDGPEEASLRKMCTDQGIKNVCFGGFKQKRDLPSYYAAADIFVFPTLGDPYGLVVDEAMACSLPVISTTSAGEIRSRIEEGVNGILVPAKSTAALADAMRRLATDAALRAAMGRESFRRIEGSTPERWAADFRATVDHVLGTAEARVKAAIASGTQAEQ